MITRYPTLGYLAQNAHYVITAGDHLDKSIQYAFNQKIPCYGFYTPKLVELLSTKTFIESADLSFVQMVSVGGAKLSSVIYDRTESEFRQRNASVIIRM